MINKTETSLLRVAFPRDATAQQPPTNHATGSATSAQQPPAKLASLLDIARNKLRNSLATNTEKDAQQAQQETCELVALEEAGWKWRVVFTDGSARICAFTPPADWPEVQQFFPAAVSANRLSDDFRLDDDFNPAEMPFFERKQK